MSVAVAAVVLLLKVTQKIFGEGDVEFVSLAAVADVDAAVVVRVSLPGLAAKIFRGRFLKLCEFAIQFGRGNFCCDARQDGAGIIFHDVAGENAERGQRARKRGDDDARDAEGFGESADVQASGAAEGDEREVARVAATLNGNYADGFFHGGIDNANDTGGEFFQSQIGTLFFQPLLRDAAGAVEIEGEIAAKKTRRLQTAEQKVDVGDGGLRAGAVADGAGIGTGGFGTNAKNSGGVEASERASAGADSVDVEHGN